MERAIGTYEYIYQLNQAKFHSIDDVLRNIVLDKIEEKFEDVYILYHYMAVQMILQMKNARIRTSVSKIHKQILQILIINLNLHLKGSQDKYLYGIIIMNDIMEQQEYKYLWQIDQFLSDDEINTKYELDMTSYPLPAPSQISYFEEDLNKKDIDRLIDNYNYKQLTLNNDQKGYKLVIDEAEWIAAFKESLDNDDSWMPMIINDDNKLQMARAKIIHIPSKDVYVGIQLEESVLPTELKEILELQEIVPKDSIRSIQGYTVGWSIIRDPRFICYTSAAASLAKSISLDEMTKYSPKWVTNIKICDFKEELIIVANKYGVDPEHVRHCYNNHKTRKSFSSAMKQQGINAGPALNIYNELGLTLSGGNNGMQLKDFSSDWEQVLQQQYESQQEIITRLKTLDKDDKKDDK